MFDAAKYTIKKLHFYIDLCVPFLDCSHEKWRGGGGGGGGGSMFPSCEKHHA